MRRRGFDVSVSDVVGFRGHYRPHLPIPDPGRVAVLRMEAADGVDTYAQWFRHAVTQTSAGTDFVVVLGPGVTPVGAATVDALVQWLQIPGVGFVTGRVVTADDRLAHAGLVLRPGGVPLALYQGFPSAEPGYMAYTAVLRNVSAPHPLCLAFRREVWDALDGLAPEFVGPHGILDMALRARLARWRVVYVPDAEFVATEEARVVAPWLAGEAESFSRAWQSWLERGDPCYPIGMSLDRADMALADDATPPPILR
jgi:O-antigen biosynthesis protein